MLHEAVNSEPRVKSWCGPTVVSAITGRARVSKVYVVEYKR
jgi:hypothetical protein